MDHKLRKRMASAVCAAAMLFSAVLFPTRVIAEETAPADSAETELLSPASDEPELCHQSIELYPNSEDAAQSITLDGMMPEGAAATAEDVSGEYEGIAAYDITIMDDECEYQPDTENPILVEISNPSIPESGNITLWHISDDGEREQISDFTLEDGKISFYAEAFSVYIIVDDAAPDNIEMENVPSLDKLEDKRAAKGFFLYYGTDKYFTNEINSTDAFIETDKLSEAAVWYFETVDATKYQYKIYTFAEGKKKYIHNKSGNLIELSEKQADTFQLSDSSTAKAFYFQLNGQSKWLQHSGSGDGIRYWTDNSNATNSRIKLYYADTYTVPDEPFTFDNKTYGLMSFTGGTHGYALMADSSDGNVHTLVELVTHQTADAEGVTLYVDEGSEVTRWTFHSAGTDQYTLSASDENGNVQYLAVSGESLITADTPDAATAFQVISDSKGRIQLLCEGGYVKYQPAADPESSATFIISPSSDANTWLSLLGFANLTDKDLITYSADRISVSDAVNGQRVIVYTRLWDDDNKKYDMYAVDYNGRLYPCYASGGKILWLGDGTGSLEWIFTEYLDEVTKEPNYYYELYNPYSEKYIAPQITGNQVLSDEPIGINMQGRRNGEFLTEIVAWDEGHYAYISLKPNETKTALVPCSQSTCVPFYFATLEPLNLSDRLHEVPTVDNAAHGITMKLIDFDGDTSKGSNGGIEQNQYLIDPNYAGGGDDLYKKYNVTPNLLSSNLASNSYPVATNTGRNLSGLFENAVDVNHLFIESIYNSSGYFEFDSCQNFATINAKEGNDFTVYRELGTSNNESKNSLLHGQFFPFDTISVGNYSKSNPKNMYPSDKTDVELPEEDPRKYERLYSAGNKNDIHYYFGMELSAEFVQTVSGLDAWGHDIIFEFTGDDDFWLYVDNELVLDLGGVHSAISGKINFRTGEVTANGKDDTLKELFRKNYQARGETGIDAKLDEIFEDNGHGQYIFKDYTKHTMRVFYMERGAGASNLHMRFNLASVTPGHVVISKSVSGEGASVLDTDFVEYPFQIYYTLPEDEEGTPGKEQLLGNDDEHIRVTYQNSNQPATFVRRYRPPGFTDEEAYENIYFLNPTKNAEIAFPDKTISYRIVECAVDSTVYGNVKINGQDVPSDRIEIKGNLRSYQSDLVTAEDRPTIAFDNFVNENVIKDLYITKKLLDENNQIITDDPTTFSFRLSLSSVDVSADEMTLANMYRYFVLDANKKMCRYDSVQKTFVPTALTYSRNNAQALENGTVEGVSYDDVTFMTSGFGAISGIPSGFTICVPGLPVGSIFKVTEDVKEGYGLVGYTRVMGAKTNADMTTEEIPSYYQYEGNPLNIGRVIADENPQMEVCNKKGYGLTANKKWSDLNITTGHEAVYTAVFADGVLLEDSVRRIKSPATSAYYFWSELKPYANGKPRTSLDGYEVCEVTLSNENPTVAADGSVSDYGTVTKLGSGEKTNLTAIRTATATPDDEARAKNYDYVISYQQGKVEGSSRTDAITNTREGGIAIRLFKWDSTDPLKGGKFTLHDSTGKCIGTYTSDADGIVTMIYSFDMEQTYTLKQTVAPKGYVGLQKPLCFVVNQDETVSLYDADGVSPWGKINSYDIRWATSRRGSGGITAFVDIYNKQFNFKIMKTDSADSAKKLGSAHFALYKQANTTISGYVKNKEPMNGFEDMVTMHGEVDVCGGNSGRVINPGTNGSVYFLTETEAPFNYDKLDEDIIFRISAIGVPSLISDSYNGQLIETEESYIYTLSVPNVIKDSTLKMLTIEKYVDGAFGDKGRDFNFTVKVEGAGDGEGFVWAKNGEQQTAMPRTGATFTLRHQESVEIALPVGVTVTVSEENGEYTPSCRLGDGAAEAVNRKKITFTDAATLTFTNTLNGEIATGIASTFGRAVMLIVIPMLPIGMILYQKRRKKHIE